VGKTTREMQRDCVLGSSLYGVTGPMGIPSQIGKAKKVACVGGGLGVAPVYPQARAYKESGAYVIGIVGFRSKELMFWQDKFGAVCDQLIVCTDDGSAGIKGMVKVKTMVSLNPLMVDGTGMCGGCRVKIGGEVKFACVDGPDFDGHLVDFDDLMIRLRRFTEQEKAAAQRWSENCRMASLPQQLKTAPPLDEAELPDPFDEVPGG
jgi:NAD(P)H-flavin reductase